MGQHLSVLGVQSADERRIQHVKFLSTLQWVSMSFWNRASNGYHCDMGKLPSIRDCQSQCAFQEIVCDILNTETEKKKKKIEPDRSSPSLFLLTLEKLSLGYTSNFQLQQRRKGGRHWALYLSASYSAWG
jgi:hypothetical protein